MRTTTLIAIYAGVMFVPGFLGFGPETSVFERIATMTMLTLFGILYEFESFCSSMEDFAESYEKGGTE